MAILGLYDPPTDLDKLDATAPSLPVSAQSHFEAALDPLRTTQLAPHFVTTTLPQVLGRALIGGLSSEPTDPAPGDYNYGDIEQKVSAEALNAQYGMPGYLRFNEPTTAQDAAWQNAQAQRRRFKDTVLASGNPTPLLNFGAGMAGGLLDPVGLAVMLATDGIGTAGLEAWGLTSAGARLAAATAKAGRVANLASRAGRLGVEGALNNAPYVGFSAAATQYSGDDYDMGDALRDIAFGALLHTSLHLAVGGVKDYLGSSRKQAGVLPPDLQRDPAAGEPAGPGGGGPGDDGGGGGGGGGPRRPGPNPAGTAPEAVDALPMESRAGAFAMAVDQVIDGEPVKVGDLVARELEPVDLNRLNEPTAEPAIPSWRPLEADDAITPRGTEVKVRYGLVELADLTTSHTNDLQTNGDFPAELQPRERSRAGAQANNLRLEAEMNPKLLMRDVSAAAGAPIVAPDGVVESGNGRTIALRRSAATGTEAYTKYRAELERQGLDTTGMHQPVLVRMRTEPMSGAERASLAREMNADVTERMSPVEQAKADAARLGDALDLIPENGSLRDPLFTKTVIARIAGDQIGVMVDKTGRLSKEGERRIRAAVIARAYGDEGLVGQIFEGEESATRKLGDALADAAPQWAKMRSLAAGNQIPGAMDLTPCLLSALSLVREARRLGTPLRDIVAERLGQRELFGGETISPASEAFLRLFFRDDQFKLPRSAEKVADALQHYAGEAMKVEPGPDLFGAIPDEGTARAILAHVASRFASGEPEPVDLRAPGRAASPEPAPVIYDVRPPGEGGGERQGSGLPAADAGGDGGAGGGTGAGQGGHADVVPPAPDEAYRQGYHEALAGHEPAVTAARGRVDDLEGQVGKAARAITDTRGEGTRFHGATAPITQLEEGYYNDANIYGGADTLYTTDAADIAAGYFRKSETGQLYEVHEVEPVRAYDMEAPAPEAHWQELFGQGEDAVGFPASAIEEAASEHGGQANLRQVMDEIRAASRSEGYSRNDVQDILHTAIETLKGQGYGAMDHVGGLKTDRPPHAVRIYFEPHTQLEVRPVDVPRAGVPDELQGQLTAAHEELAKAEATATLAAETAGREASAAAEAAAKGAAPKPEDLIAADPELKALADDNERLFAENGLEPAPVRPADEPGALTKGIHAAAVCLIEEGL